MPTHTQTQTHTRVAAAATTAAEMLMNFDATHMVGCHMWACHVCNTSKYVWTHMGLWVSHACPMQPDVVIRNVAYFRKCVYPVWDAVRELNDFSRVSNCRWASRTSSSATRCVRVRVAFFFYSHAGLFYVVVRDCHACKSCGMKCKWTFLHLHMRFKFVHI